MSQAGTETTNPTALKSRWMFSHSKVLGYVKYSIVVRQVASGLSGYPHKYRYTGAGWKPSSVAVSPC